MSSAKPTDPDPAPPRVILLPGSRSGYWHVVANDKRAGSVQVSPSFHPDLGEHMSIDIRLNQTARGRGIGRVALRLAVEACGAAEVFAHMSKKNVASYKAAKHAGFVDVVLPHERQRVLRWRATASRRR